MRHSYCSSCCIDTSTAFGPCSAHASGVWLLSAVPALSGGEIWGPNIEVRRIFPDISSVRWLLMIEESTSFSFFDRVATTRDSKEAEEDRCGFRPIRQPTRSWIVISLVKDSASGCSSSRRAASSRISVGLTLTRPRPRTHCSPGRSAWAGCTWTRTCLARCWHWRQACLRSANPPAVRSP